MAPPSEALLCAFVEWPLRWAGEPPASSVVSGSILSFVFGVLQCMVCEQNKTRLASQDVTQNVKLKAFRPLSLLQNASIFSERESMRNWKIIYNSRRRNAQKETEDWKYKLASSTRDKLLLRYNKSKYIQYI